MNFSRSEILINSLWFNNASSQVHSQVSKIIRSPIKGWCILFKYSTGFDY